MTIPQFLAWAVIFSIPVIWIAFVLLGILSHKKPHNGILRHDFYEAGYKVLLFTVFGIVFLSNDQKSPWFTMFQTQIGTRTVILLGLATTLYWLWLWWSRK